MQAFRERARQLDIDDPLAGFRERFVVDELIYLDGNSLGRLPKATSARMREAVDVQWGGRLIRSWGEEWLGLPRRVGGKIAHLVGAKEDELLACDSTSVNFFKLAQAALTSTERKVVVTNTFNFPSDLYLLQGLGIEIRQLDTEDDGAIMAALDEDVALLTLSHVEFKSGLRHDLKRLTDAAHAAGARVLWDLSHSVGAVPISLGDADLAVGCSYKYLNGGPGAPAFLYVRRDLQEQLRNPIQGWFGGRNAFEFGLDYTPAPGIDRFLAGTPPILALSAVEPGVDLLLEAGIEAIWRKSATQTSFLIEMAQASGLEVVTPLDPNRRGSHVALRHPEAWRISQSLVKNEEVIPDFRSPDVLRLGIAPLYTRYSDLVEAIVRILRVIESGSYRVFETTIGDVT